MKETFISILLYFIFISIFFKSSLSANILFFFGGSNFSHKQSAWPLVRELAKNGHNVTFISSSAKQPFPIDNITDITPPDLTKSTKGFYGRNRFEDRINKNEKIEFETYDDGSLTTCRNTLDPNSTTMANIIENGTFDLVVVNTIRGECGFLLAHHFKSKSILFDASVFQPNFHGIYGVPLENSWIPSLKFSTTYPLSFLDRIVNFYTSYKSYSREQDFSDSMIHLYTKRFNLKKKQVPTFSELERNISIALINSHYSLDFAKSLPPMFINIGGMILWEPENSLEESFKQFIDGADDGVVLISFGSTIIFNNLPQKYIDIFFTMMRKFSKLRFIWRWNGTLPSDSPPNLLSSNWLPQREILAHKSVKALMTHCGLNSLHEATYYGVPVIGMPLFADQDYLSYRIEAQKVGVKIEARDFSQEILDGAVNEIVYNKKYKMKAESLSKLFRDRPNPSKTAYEAVEFVLRNDDLSSLKPMELDQSFWTRYSIDIMLAIFLSISLPIFILILIASRFI